jgi:hypothetical protein
MQYITLLWAAFHAALVRADMCSEICEMIPGACSQKGSYCKNNDSCMDLFWHADDILCNHMTAGCTENPPLKCAEATYIIASNNPHGVVALAYGVDVPKKPVAPSTTLRTSSELPVSRRQPFRNQAGRGPVARRIRNMRYTCYLIIC